MAKATFLRFELKIVLGNDAMMSEDDLAQALHRIADRIGAGEAPDGKIMDRNGNAVGTYRLREVVA